MLFPAACLRRRRLAQKFRAAFGPLIQGKWRNEISFEMLSAQELSKILLTSPPALEPLLEACDLKIDELERVLKIPKMALSASRFTEAQAQQLAGYFLGALPLYNHVPTLLLNDSLLFIARGSRIRADHFEETVEKALRKHAALRFEGRKLRAAGSEYELKAAVSPVGAIQVGLDVARFKPRSHVQACCEEIIMKAKALKSVFPNAKFGAIVQAPVQRARKKAKEILICPWIEVIVLASGTSATIENAMRMLLGALGCEGTVADTP